VLPALWQIRKTTQERVVMENLQIFHINVNCSNLERSLEFYKAIGL